MAKITNPYKVVSLGNGIYGAQYKDYPYIGIPESWGTRKHATAYMAALLGLTLDEYKRLNSNEKD